MSGRNIRVPKYFRRCNKVFVNNKWIDLRNCTYGIRCDNCHTEEEYENHPQNNYKIQKLPIPIIQVK